MEKFCGAIKNPFLLVWSQGYYSLTFLVKQVPTDPTWVKYKNMEYKVVTSSILDLEGAKLYCQADDAGLVEINSEEEHNLILYLTKRRTSF